MPAVIAEQGFLMRVCARWRLPPVCRLAHWRTVFSQRLDTMRYRSLGRALFSRAGRLCKLRRIMIGATLGRSPAWSGLANIAAQESFCTGHSAC